MIERDVQIAAPDGTADAVVLSPDDAAHPGVIHLTDIGGIRDAQREMARRLAAEGYVVLMPNVFYRTGRPPVFDFPMQFGEERTMKRLGELRGPLTPEAQERDVSAYVDFLARDAGAADGPMGVVGYCFSGAMALRTAAARPDRIAAAASFHGGSLFTDDATSPHRLLPLVKARLYVGYAVEDRTMPVEATMKLDAALSDWGGEFESETYEGARHGWTVPGSPVHNPAQAERAFQKLAALFAATLKT